MLYGKVSSKYQLTLPAEVRRALRIRPGDAVRYELEGSRVRVSVVRPQLGDVLESVLGDYDFKALSEVTQNDAVRYLRQERGLNAQDDTSHFFC